MRIRWEEMRGAELVTWHAGRWLLGRPILRVDWEREGKALSSGFHLEPDRERMRRFADELAERIARTPR